MLATGINSAKEEKSATGQDGLADIFSLGIQTSSAGSNKQLRDLVEFYQEEIKAKNLPFVVGEVSETNKLAMPVVYIASTQKAFPGFVSILVPGLAAPLVNRTETNGQNSYDVDVLPSSAHDQFMITEVNAAVTRITGGHAQMVEVGHVIIPQDKELTDMHITRAVLDNALLALVDYMRLKGAAPDLTVKALESRQVEVNAHIDVHGGGTRYNAFGRPLTSDVTATLFAENKTKSTSPNQKESTTMLVKSEAYLDFIFEKEQFNTNDPHARCRAYHPIMVMTEATALTAGRSIETQITPILGLVAMFDLLVDRNYLAIFETNNLGASAKPSLGVLGYEHNPFPNQSAKPEEIKVSNGFDAADDRIDLLTLSENFIFDEITLAIDVIDGDSSSWSKALLLQAAFGSQAAADLLIQKIDQFLDGDYLRAGGADIPLFTNEPVAIHAGTYTKQDGTQGALTDYNHLKMVELLGPKCRDAEEFLETFVPGNDHLVNLDKRRRTYKDVDPTANIDGLGSRIFLNPQVIELIARILGKRNVSIGGDRCTRNQGLSRGTGFNGGSSISSNAGKGMFNNGSNNKNGGFQKPFFTNSPFGQ